MASSKGAKATTGKRMPAMPKGKKPMVMIAIAMPKRKGGK